MTSPHYTYDFLINIAGINIGVHFEKNLQNDYYWRDLFSTRLKNCLLKNNIGLHPSHQIFLTGRVRDHVCLPQVKGRTLVFSNLLHPNLLFLNLHNLIQRELAHRNILSLHASGVVTGSAAVLFSGISGSGKSTALSQKPKKSLVIGEDCVLIEIVNGRVIAHPSPFNDKLIVDRLPPSGAPISKICFIDQHGPVKITKILPIQALPLILSQLITPPYNITIRKLLMEISSILSQNAYQLNYSLGEDIHEIF